MLRTLQTNFTGGVVSSDARERLDLAVWKNSLAQGDNIRIHPQGGASRRPGMVLVDNNGANYNTAASYQIEAFVFSDNQQYVVVISGGVARIYVKGSRTFLQNVTLPYSSAIVAANELSIVQSFDTMLMFHKDYEPLRLIREADGTFHVTTMPWSEFSDGTTSVERPPFHKYAGAGVTMWSDLQDNDPGTGNLTIRTSDGFFESGHIGYWINLRGNYIRVDAVQNPNQATGVTASDLGTSFGVPSIEWQESAFSPVRGWPRCAVRHQQRLWLGGGRDLPNTVWGSTTFDPYNFFLGDGMSTDAIKYTADSDRVGEIRRMVSFGTLQVYMADAEFYAPNPDPGALTPGNFSLRQQSGYGIASAPAIRFDQSTIFISRAANSIRDFTYDALQASYSADALTFMAKDLVRSPIDIDAAMETDFAQEALAIVTNSDGTLAILSKVRKENVGSWFLWSTAGTIRRVGVVQREIWAIVDRFILNAFGVGAWKRGLEVFDNNYMLDFAAGHTVGSPTTAWSFPHLANQTASFRSGDLYLGELAVPNSGNVVLPTAVAVLEAGYNFVPTIVPLVQEVQLPDGLSWGEPRRVCSTTVSFSDTISLQIDAERVPTDNAAGDPALAPDRMTGKFKSWRIGWGIAEAPVITSPAPLPLYLRAIGMEVEI